MAEIQGLKPNLSILAKLMVLEEIDRGLFNDLYVWQSANNGKAEELKDIYESIKEGTDLTDTKYSKWNSDKMKNWVVVEPYNLYEEDLREYFYLSRESISEVSFVKNKLSFDERKILDDICGAQDKTVRRKLIEQLESKTEETREKIIKALLSKFRQDRNLFEDMINIYKNFDCYKDLIIKEFKSIQSKDLSSSNIMLLATLSKSNDEKIEELIVYLKSQGVFEEKHQKAFDKIKNM